MIQTTRASSPLKGVNRAFARESQPDGTCWDAKNVLPQDRYGRLRLGQRSGLGQLAVLDDGFPVRLLHVASSARTPGSGAVTFVRADNPEAAMGFEADAIAHGPIDAALLYSDTRRPDPTFNFPGEFTSGNTNYAQISTVGGQSGLRQSRSVTGAVPQYGYVGNASAIGVSATWLAASDAIWFEMVVRFQNQDSDPGVVSAAQFSLDIAMPVSEWASNAGANMNPAIFMSWGGVPSIITAAGGYASGGFVTMTEEITPAPYNVSTTQDYKLIAVITAGHLYMYVDDFTTMTLVDQYSMPIEISIADVINGTFAVGVQSVIDTTTQTGTCADTVKTINIYQASSAASNVSRTALQLVGVADTFTYIGDPTSMPQIANSSSFPVNADALFLAATTLFNYTYIVDGTQKPLKINLATDLFEIFTEDAGTAPDDANIACTWRGRLVLSGSTDDPQNFFASRAGDPLDWDYSQEDPTAAFAGNAANSGRIGEPIHALIPVSDDILVIGCEQSMWAVRGDIADGGAIDQVTGFAGISSSTSWTRGPDGSLYFVGPRGFFKMNPTATQVEEVSQTAYPQFFQNINRATSYINMIYDSDRYGIWVFVSPLVSGSSVSSIFYDFRFQGYWPQDWRNQTNAGPIQAIYWDGYDSDTRYPVLGGFDGHLYAFNLTNRTDNGGAINASVTLGPFHPQQDGEAMLVGLTANFGELAPQDQSTPDRWQTSVSLFSGKSAYDVTEGTPTTTALVGWGRDGRTKTMRQRLKGEWFTVELSNAAASNYFSMESVELEFESKGKNRRQR